MINKCIKIILFNNNNNFDIRYESKNIEKIYLKLNYFIAEE